MIEIDKIFNEDCLKGMKRIPDGSCDMILCDLPYGVLGSTSKSSKWDNIIPFEPLWEQYKRIIKSDGAIVLFGQGMFTAKLMMSNQSMWRYNLVWKKNNRTSGFLNANRQPLRNHEDIVVFSKKQSVYNPQMTKGERCHMKGGARNGYVGNPAKNNCYRMFKQTPAVLTNEKYPLSVLNFDRDYPSVHPTQKPIKLCEYLIKTYSNEGDLVLDNTCGSGSTIVAAINTDRHYLGFELEKQYFDIAKQRIENALQLKKQRNNSPVITWI